MDLGKGTTMRGIWMFWLFCRLALQQKEIAEKGWCFSVHMLMEVFER